MATGLPVGFTLDQEQQPQGGGLPPGFKLDQKISPPKYEGWGALLDRAAYRVGGATTDALAGKVPPG